MPTKEDRFEVFYGLGCLNFSSIMGREELISKPFWKSCLRLWGVVAELILPDFLAELIYVDPLYGQKFGVVSPF